MSLLERRIDVVLYIKQLMRYIIPLLLVDGPAKALEALILESNTRSVQKTRLFLTFIKAKLLSNMHDDRVSTNN